MKGPFFAAIHTLDVVELLAASAGFRATLPGTLKTSGVRGAS
jgi:hypothetical protein